MKPCSQCPWRLANQGKRHPSDFYTARNLRRLWNQLRSGGAPQSCHLTDPSHPDHVAAGAKPGAKAQECPGSVIVVKREMGRIANEQGVINDEGVERYLSVWKGGLTKRGILYWCVQRLALAGTILGAAPLPEVDENDEEIGLPEALRRN